MVSDSESGLFDNCSEVSKKESPLGLRKSLVSRSAAVTAVAVVLSVISQALILFVMLQNDGRDRMIELLQQLELVIFHDVLDTVD